MKLVIDISEEDYERCKKKFLMRLNIMGDAIANGTPLPKEHGRLGDLDALEKEMIGGIKKSNYEEGYEMFLPINNVDDCVLCVRYADTIIEADKGEENE